MNCPRVFVIEFGGFGGISHYTYNLLQNYDDSVCPILYTGFPYEMADLVQGFPYKCAFRRFRTNPLRILEIYIDAIRRQPKAVHFQLNKHPSLVLMMMALFRLLGIRVVTTAHNVLPHESRLWQPWLYQSIYRFSNHIVVHSRHSKQEIVDKFGLDPGVIDVIDHGNYMFFGNGEDSGCTSDDGVFRILFFGYIRKYKGLSILLKALRSLCKGQCRFILEIVGKPVEPFEPYQVLIEEYGLTEYVQTRLGYVPVEEVRDYFSRASVVVLPYLKISQSGVLQLAYAFGKPVIVTDTGGLPEVVEDGESGYVVPPGDDVALARRLGEMMGDPDLVPRMGQRARELSETRFSWKRIAPLNQALYFQG